MFLLLLLLSQTILLQATESMNILVVGSGGREHALAHKLAQSPLVKKIYVAPGNGGTASMERVENCAMSATNIQGLTDFAKKNGIDFTIVGPEAPLAEGIADRFQEQNLAIVGPSKEAAQLETSKAFAKKFMEQHGIPTAACEIVTTIEQATQYINNHNGTLVIKADGLTGGKGVFITSDKAEAQEIVSNMLNGSSFGNAGKQIVFEEFLEGEEVSFIVLSDGKNVVPLITTQDYKQRDNGNKGPNTGGMGVHCPAPCVTPKMHERIMKTIIEPTIKHMHDAGIPYVGFLYAGLMITKAGEPKVLEFNCRLGDPEAQLILLSMQSDLLSLCKAVVEKKLDQIKIAWSDQKGVGVVVADGGYPGPLKLNQPITIAPHADTTIFHAGTKLLDGKLLSSGGRILCVCSFADTFCKAREKVYAQVRDIQLEHVHYRTDIAETLT